MLNHLVPVIAVLVCWLTGDAMAGNPNLLKNASFEVDADADGVPDDWTLGAGRYGRWMETVKKQLGKAALTEARAVIGRRSVAVTVPKDNEGKYWNQGWEGLSLRQKVSTKPFTVYTMSMQVYNDDTSGLTGDYAFLYALAGPFRSNESLSLIRFPEKPSGNWVNKQFVFQTGRYTDYTVVSVETRWNIGTLHFDDVRLVEGGELQLSEWDQPVPENRLLPVKFTFPRQTVEEVARRFEEHHQSAEKNYRGNGSWESSDTLNGKPGGEQKEPDLKAIYQRVDGYLGAYAALNKPIYLQRATEGCGYLLNVQQDDGQIGDAYYSSGQGGVALMHAWQQTRDGRYLDAVERITEHFNNTEASWNFNYNMMLTDAALSWAQASGKFDVVAAKLQTDMLQSTLREQRPWGGWPDHNSRIGYHCANMKCFCQLYQSLPEDTRYDELRETLKRRVMCALNRMIIEQTDAGGFPYEHGNPSTARQNSGIVPALVRVHETFGWDEARLLLNGHMTYLSTDACGKYYWLPQRRTYLDMSRLHSEGVYLKWASEHPE